MVRRARRSGDGGAGPERVAKMSLKTLNTTNEIRCVYIHSLGVTTGHAAPASPGHFSSGHKFTMNTLLKGPLLFQARQPRRPGMAMGLLAGWLALAFALGGCSKPAP